MKPERMRRLEIEMNLWYALTTLSLVLVLGMVGV